MWTWGCGGVGVWQGRGQASQARLISGRLAFTGETVCYSCSVGLPGSRGSGRGLALLLGFWIQLEDLPRAEATGAARASGASRLLRQPDAVVM